MAPAPSAHANASHSNQKADAQFQIPQQVLTAHLYFRAALFSSLVAGLRGCCRLPPLHVPAEASRPFATASLRLPIYELATTTQLERRSVVLCGGVARVAVLLTQGRGWGGAVDRVCHVLMLCILRREASGRVARPELFFQEAQRLRAAGHAAEAVANYEHAITRGHTQARAELAYVLRKDNALLALQLAEEGALLGCVHCSGMVAWFLYRGPYDNSDSGARCLLLARESSAAGSRYGQQVMGWFHYRGRPGVFEKDHAAALALFLLAAQLGLADAQAQVGHMHVYGEGAPADLSVALMWYRKAADQGMPSACQQVAQFHEWGRGIPRDVAEAIRWYKRALELGCSEAARDLQRLQA